MFHQVKVKKEYRNFMRFLCCPGGETSQVVQTCKVEVHLFGAMCSPGCSNFVLKENADDNEREFWKEPAEFLGRNLYANDRLRSIFSNLKL